MFIVKSDFIGSFKLGDNINYNLKILEYLYKQFNVLENEIVDDERYLIKPIVFLNVSIVEAILYDFLKIRIGTHTVEGVDGVLSNIIKNIKGKKLNKLDNYIDQAQKYDFFELSSTDFYEKLRELSKIRNRIHLQNTKFHKPEDEYDLFTKDVKILSEKVVEKVMRTMIDKYSRGENYSGYVDDFALPWEEHFPIQE